MLSVKHTTAQWDRLYRGMCWIWIRKSFMPSKNKTFLEVSMYTCSSGFQTTTIPFPVNIYKWQRLSGMLNILQDKTQPWFARRGGVCVNAFGARQQPCRQCAAHRRSIPGERRGATGGCSFPMLTREVYGNVLVFFFHFFFPWASISNDLFRCKQWQL